MREASSVGRTVAVPEAATVYTTGLDMRSTMDGKVTCELSVTCATMTQIDWVAYVSGTVSAADVPLWNAGIPMAGTVTGTKSQSWTFDACGQRYLRVGITETGATGAGDRIALTYRYNDYVSSASTDGALRLE